MSIRNRILVFAILVTLVPSLGLGWLYFSQAEKAVRESARQELATTAAHVERELQLWLKERFYEIRVFSSSYLLTGALETLHREEGSRGALANIHDYLSLIRDQYGIYTAFQLFDEGGEPILQDPADGHSWQLPANWRQQLGRQKGFTGEFSRKGENNIRLLLGVPITSREGLLQGLLAASVESSALATLFRCPPWRAKRRRVVPGSREATRDTRRAEGAKGDPKGASERGVQSYGRPVCSRNELAMLWRNAG